MPGIARTHRHHERIAAHLATVGMHGANRATAIMAVDTESLHRF
jgi:hypothetical protein